LLNLINTNLSHRRVCKVGIGAIIHRLHFPEIIALEWLVRAVSTVDHVIQRVEVKFSCRGDDSNVADTDTLSPIFDRKLHSWLRHP
jgi:hypothetical protein